MNEQEFRSKDTRKNAMDHEYEMDFVGEPAPSGYEPDNLPPIDRMSDRVENLEEALYVAREYVNVNAFAGCPNAVETLKTIDETLKG